MTDSNVVLFHEPKQDACSTGGILGAAISLTVVLCLARLPELVLGIII